MHSLYDDYGQIKTWDSLRRVGVVLAVGGLGGTILSLVAIFAAISAMHKPVLAAEYITYGLSIIAALMMFVVFLMGLVVFRDANDALNRFRGGRADQSMEVAPPQGCGSGCRQRGHVLS